MLTHTDSSLATSHISNSNTPTHVSEDNTVPYQTEHTASPSTTSDYFITEGNILSSCSSEQSPITPEETSFMAMIPTMPASDTDTHEPNTLPLPSPHSAYSGSSSMDGYVIEVMQDIPIAVLELTMN